jgi:hypothetical protein
MIGTVVGICMKPVIWCTKPIDTCLRPGVITYERQVILDEQERLLQEQRKKEEIEKKKKQSKSYPVASKAEAQRYAKEKLKEYGWSEDDWNALVKLWNRESNWRSNAKNGSCYGIPQACPGTKMGKDYKDWKVQINWGLKYIKKRYGNPQNAWAHSQKVGWY